ncbi:hypothetical protein INT45_006184 [Circinella minor]|uniref:Uncharacterized protein n=1 Tax=Circinella minor TaxID=1195481 RepID=A0A8H7RVM9_9FUNG|nr:hypothetical protein INT45_006184 [Circinella minor]
MRSKLSNIEEALVYGLEKSIPPTSCPYQYWFTAPYFAQIAADTYRRPVAVYTDDITKNPSSDELAYELLMYVPFQGPLPNDREPIPIIMQFLNNNHWATIKSKGRIIRIDWPIIDGYCIKAFESTGHTTNLRKSISWRYLSLKKRNNEKTAHNQDPVVFD